MDSLFFLGWTRAQWDAWESHKVTIPLEMLDNLITATELLSEGRRPGEYAKDRWAEIAKEASALIEPYIAEIDAMAAS